MTLINLSARVQQVRAADAPENPRGIGGTLVTYGTIAYPMGPWEAVRFAAGSLEVPSELGRVKLLRDHDPRQPLGAMVEMASDDAEATGSFTVTRTAAADEALMLAADGVLDGLSVGVEVIDSRTVQVDGQDVQEITRARLREVSLVPIPAYDDARVSSVAASGRTPDMTPPTVVEPTTVIPADRGDDIRAAVQAAMADLAPADAAPLGAAIPGAPAGAAPEPRVHVSASGWGTPRELAVRGRDGSLITAGAYFGAFMTGRDDGRWDEFQRIQAALSHEKTTDIPGLLPQQILGPIINVIDTSRPVWTSLNVRVMPARSGVFSRPSISQHTQVGPQAEEKTELVSRPLKVILTDVPKSTVGGALNISRQVIDWSEPSALDLIIQDLSDQYAIYSEKYASDALVAKATGTTTAVNNDPAEINAAIYTAAAAVFAATKIMPDRVWMSPDVWALLGALADTTKRPINPAIGPNNAMGVQTADSFEGQVNGLRRVVGAQLPAGTLLVGSSRYGELYEDRRGLLRVDEPSILGMQIAAYGYVANYWPVTGSVQKIELTAPAPEALAASTTTK